MHQYHDSALERTETVSYDYNNYHILSILYSRPHAHQQHEVFPFKRVQK